MKILLINAPPLQSLGITGQIYPPLGILYIASYARRQIPELEIRAIDGYHEETRKLLATAKRYDPDIIGVSFTTQASTGAYSLINDLKKFLPKTKIVTGGPHSTIMPDEIFARSATDVVVIGEGECTFVEILEQMPQLSDLGSVRGIAYVHGDQVVKTDPRPLIKDLDTIPFPARELLDIRRYPGYIYKKTSMDTDIISSRGCPYNCVYCSNPVWKMNKPWFRSRSPSNVVDEIECIVKEYGIKEIFDETDEFNANKKWASQVCDEMIQRKLGIKWKAQMRVDAIDEELADHLKRSGFWMALFGLESAHDRTLKGIKKHQTVSQMDRALSIMSSRGIMCFGLFMAFNVWEENGELCYENSDESLATLDYARKLLKEKKISLFGWSMTTPYPGSQLFDIARRHNLIPENMYGKWDNFDSGANFIMSLPLVSTEDWLHVLNAGKRLQARLLFTSGTFNIKALPLYIKKGYQLIRNYIKKRFVTKKQENT